MTPKEKAKELFDKHFEFVEALSAQNQIENAKQCALITVDEIIQAIRYTDAKSDLGYVGYLQEVKKEIENITL